MQHIRRIAMIMFGLATTGLVAFCLVFGIPFVSGIAARKVVAWGGCTPPGFDIQAVCPPGSFAEPFVPLSHWFTSGFAPLVLMENFGGMLSAWTVVCAAFGLLWFALSVGRMAQAAR